jgi:hypothetical protein
MNVWDNMTGARPRNHKPEATTQSPRTRTGQAFPGGKTLRKALQALSIRQNTYTATAKPSGHANHKPGSMRGRI